MFLSEILYQLMFRYYMHFFTDTNKKRLYNVNKFLSKITFVYYSRTYLSIIATKATN